MALFGNLFEKKYCDICGKEIGLLGNRKLEDGNLCKDCAAKLSPWFSDRRRSTVEEIREQLAYREANRDVLAAFVPTLVLGHNTKIYIDEEKKQMAVSSRSNWRELNTDVIPLSLVQNCEIDVREHKEEIYTKDKDGKRVSYNPRQYKHEYEFRVNITCDSPYYPEISFELTDDRPVNPMVIAYKVYEQEGKAIQNALCPDLYPAEETVPKEPVSVLEVTEPDTWTCACGTENTGNFCSECGKPRPVYWFCPECGTKNSGKFCTNCGTKKTE